MILYLSALTLSLYGFWLLLSGLWNDPLFQALGGACALLVALLAWRIERRDPERHGLTLLLHLIPYWAWLLRKVIQSNFDVARSIWQPNRYPISPALTQIPAPQRTPTGRAIFANSITLTPGTVAVEVGEQSILVHSLRVESARELAEGEMGRRVCRLEGRPT